MRLAELEFGGNFPKGNGVKFNWKHPGLSRAVTFLAKHVWSLHSVYREEGLCSTWPQLSHCLFRLILRAAAVLEVSVGHAKDAPGLFLWQGSHRWVWNPQVPAAWHLGGAAASASPHPHPQVPGKLRHCHVVPHLHVGSYLFEVNQLGAAFLGLFQTFGRPTERIACTQPALGYLNIHRIERWCSFGRDWDESAAPKVWVGDMQGVILEVLLVWKLAAAGNRKAAQRVWCRDFMQSSGFAECRYCHPCKVCCLSTSDFLLCKAEGTLCSQLL